MADAALSFAIENVGKFVIENAKFLSGVRDEVEEMQIELEWMQCFLRDADRRQHESLRVRNWVSQIREATYDVEDVIERFALKTALRRRVGVVHRIKRYAFFIKHVVELHQVGSRIEAIKTRLTKLRTRLQIYGIKEIRVGRKEAVSSTSRWRKRQDYAHVIDHNVVGLDHKITELADKLLDVGQEQEEDKLEQPIIARRSDSVICISGMGGLGKTTLAKKVYGDSRVRGHFEGFAWVYLSQQFREKDIWKSILSQLSNNKRDTVEDEELASELCKAQREKRCLVVIDDIWSNEAWAELSPAFPYLEEGNKSKILLTTRNKDVALHGVHHTGLNTLDDTNSLKLLINTIRHLGGPHHPIKDNLILEQRACEMGKQCAGLPLAITVLGGILATKHELKEWDIVGDNIKLLLNRGNEKEDMGVSSVLESSYYDLPYDLKSCFLYLSRYPEDHEIKTTKLTQMWMGEGFLVSSECVGQTAEDVGEQYLNELVSRCMIQVGRRSYTGRVKSCRMHDLMRDLCISKAKEENFIHFIDVEGHGMEKTEHLDKTRSNGKIRRICISHRWDLDLPISFAHESFPQLRSLFWFRDTDSNKICSIVKYLKLCRVLVVEKIEYMMESVVPNLLHLRYLSLRIQGALGPSMYNVSSLQTLDLRECSGLILSNSIWQMEQLRHLYLPRNCCKCESRKQRVGNLRNLQTLINFPPDDFDLQQNLVKFTHVKKLGLFYMGDKKVREAIRSKKLGFTRLHSLSLAYVPYTERGFVGNFENIEDLIDLEAATAWCPNIYKLCVAQRIKIRGASPTLITCLWPSNLTKLVLYQSGLDANYLESLGKLRSLKILFMHWNAFMEKEMIFHENDFPQLQHLLVQYLDKLEAWTVHEGALPSLSHLEIASCENLKSVPVGFEHLKQLKKLQVKLMPFSFKKRLESGGDDWHKVSHVSSVSFIHCYPDLRPQTSISGN